MNTTETNQIIQQAETLGLKLEVREGKLAVTPASQCPRHLVDAMRQHRTELIRLLSAENVPPANLALNTSRPDPRRLGASSIMQFVVSQIPGTPNALCEWCLRRELNYYDSQGWSHEECALAAARDAAAWQLKLSDDQLWARFASN